MSGLWKTIVTSVNEYQTDTKYQTDIRILLCAETDAKITVHLTQTTNKFALGTDVRW